MGMGHGLALSPTSYNVNVTRVPVFARLALVATIPTSASAEWDKILCWGVYLFQYIFIKRRPGPGAERKKWDIIIFQGWVNRESRNIRWKINLSKMITQASFQREFLLSFLLWNSLLTFHKIIHLQSFCCWSSQLSLSRKINFPIARCCCPAAGLTICRPTWLGAQLLYQSEETFSNCLDLNSWRSCS